ncbi:MAG: hypothetical protein P8K10_08215 [Crocinitomicaceae bacterium]|nr:hypothetical protein [Crocinitomicaceae bacterium]
MKAIQNFFLFSLLFSVQVHGQKSKTSTPKHIIKLGITPIVVGEVLPSYEYVFTDKFGLEAGIGFVTENYLNQFIQESNFGNTRLMKFGPSFLIAARYYPFRRADYMYCKGEMKYRRYKEVYQEISGSGNTETINEYERKFIPRVGIGYQLYLDKHFLFDMNANIGLAFIKDYQFGSNAPVKNTKLHFGLGLKFAYAF